MIGGDLGTLGEADICGFRVEAAMLDVGSGAPVPSNLGK